MRLNTEMCEAGCGDYAMREAGGFGYSLTIFTSIFRAALVGDHGMWARNLTIMVLLSSLPPRPGA